MIKQLALISSAALLAACTGQTNTSSSSQVVVSSSQVVVSSSQVVVSSSQVAVSSRQSVVSSSQLVVSSQVRSSSVPVVVSSAAAMSSSSVADIDRGHHVAPVTQVKSGRQMEALDRGLVAVKTGEGVYLSWRLWADEPKSTGFNIYRNGQKITNSPITTKTNYVDQGAAQNSTYSVRAVINGVERKASKDVSVWAQQYKSINLTPPPADKIPSGEAYTYSPGDASVGDVDGDGEYEIFLKWDPSNQRDSESFGYTGKVFIDAYKMSGQRLWRVDLGPNIRAGAHDTQFMVFDFDGDGKAEMAVRTSDGAKDSAGKLIGEANKNHYVSGHIGTGPEYLTMFNGATGVAMASVAYPNSRGNLQDWGGDSMSRKLNRSNRFLAGVAYVNGETPSMIWARGYYDYGADGQTKIAAVDWKDGKFTTRWEFLANKRSGLNRNYIYQGAHSLSIADVDGDGRDEIVYGAATINDDGKGLYTTGLCHGDALHVTDIDLSNPGLEVFMVHESPSCYGDHGVEVHDAATGRILYSAKVSGDIGRGVAADVNPDHPGVEVFGSSGGTLTADRKVLTGRPGTNFAIWWDGDLLRELGGGTVVNKWDYRAGRTNTIFDAAAVFGGASNNGTKATPSLSADILGDWREELIMRTSDNSKLVIATTITPTDHRIYTLMHDSQYRVAIAWQNVAYNQPPHPGFFLGHDMQDAPTPKMYYAGAESETSSEPILEVQENAAGFCSVAGVVENIQGGYTGTAGYANTDNAMGVSVTWALNVPKTDDYTLSIRYAGVSNRPGALSINGTARGTFNFASTTSWTNWQTETLKVRLTAGNNTLKLTANTMEGLANIDVLKVWHTGALAGKCP
ncbi:MAG: CBM35 domain-containing protein [Marinagarivorans sp.]|nr:CBM35 domain-containing protein [Marinagarivorans sp.]